MMRLPSSVERAVHRDEASSRSTIDSPVSSSTLTCAGVVRSPDHTEHVDSLVRTHDLDLSTELTPTTDPSAPTERIGCSMPMIHLSQAPPITKYGGNSNSKTLKEWYEQFELVAAACGWNDKLKLANLATQLHGQAYASYQTCTSQ